MMASEGGALIDRWTRVLQGGSGTVGLNAEMTRLTLRIVGRALFGSAMDELIPIVSTAVPYLSERALRRGLGCGRGLRDAEGENVTVLRS